MTKKMRFALPLLYLCILSIPISIFWIDKGGLSAFIQKDFGSFAANIFPLLGLYTFVLLWAQIIIGSQMVFLRRVFPNVEIFHRAQGVIALCLAFTHPILLVVSTGLKQYLSYTFVSPEQRVFAIMGQVQLVLLLTTVSSALLMKHRLFKERWRTIHYLNYFVFF